MRKLKVVLVLLCAMLVSVGLFACKKKKPNEPVDPTPPPDDNSITAITGVEDIPTLTDSDDASVYQEKIKDITVTYRVGRTTGSVKGSACDITGEISYHKVGTYTLKAKPRDNNSGGKTIEFKIKVVHDFDEADEHGVSTCDYCKARRVASEEELTLHYGDFHYGTTAKLPKDVYEETEVVTYGEGKEATSNIKQFGSVNGATSALEVPTLTAGDLEKGTTITVRGTAKTAWEDWGLQENKFWFFPVIGFADPYMNNASFDGKTHSSYVGGTSVFVRGEGWVLYNGVGDPRTLASLSGGQSERINYGSWEGASAGSDNPIPDGFVNGEMPDPASDAWHDWWVYSFGTQINSGDFYQDETPIELVWTYREDGIIELQYNYNYVSATNAVSLVAYVKVPDSTRGYYRTMLHGDYVDMTITGYEKIETLTPTDFQFNAEATGTVVLHEGAMLDASALKTQFKYVQTGDAWQPYTVVADNVYATTDETVDEETEWVSLGENALRTAYKNYKIELIKAGQTFTASIPAANIKVVSNAIAEAFGSDATIGGVSFVNNRKVGAFALGTDAEGTAITLALQGAANYAQALNAAQKTALNITEGEYRYVVLRLTNNGLKAFDKTGVTVKSGTTDVPYLVDVQDGDAYLVLALTEETARGGVVIGGLNGTPVNVSFGTLNGFKITSTVSSATSGKLNEGGSVTFTFTAVAGSTIGEIKVGSTTMGVDILTGAISNTTTYPNGILVDSNKFITAIAREGQSVTLTVKFPAANISDYSSCEIGALLEGAAGADIMEEVHYEFAFADNVQGDKGAVLNSHSYAYEKDGKLIVVAALAGMDDVTELDTPIASNVNVNAGDLENIRLLDLSYVYSREEQTLVFTDAANLPAGVSLRYQEVSGVGILLFFEFDKAKLGFEGDYAFEPNYTEGGNVYYAVKDGAVTAVTVTDEGEKQVIVPGNCIDAGVSAVELKDGNDVVFYFHPSKTGGEHKDNGNGLCLHCGASIAARTAPAKWYSGQRSEAIADGEFVEFIGKYSDNEEECGSAKAAPNGYGLVLEDNNKAYYMLSADGLFLSAPWNWVGRTSPYSDLEGVPEEVANGDPNMYSSLITEKHLTNTAYGILDADGNTFESVYNEVKVGGTYRYTITYTGGVVTMRMRLYAKGIGIDGTPHFDFYVTVKIALDSADRIVLQGSDAFTDKEVGYKNCTLNVVRGKLENASVLTSITGNRITVGNDTFETTSVSYGTPAVADGVATVLANGVATKLAAGQTTFDTAKYTHYIAFGLNMAVPYAPSTKLVIKDADGTAVADAEYQLTEDGCLVVIPVKSGELSAYYTFESSNADGYTNQCTIKLDCSNVSVSNFVINPENSLTLAGGTLKLTFSGGTISDDMLLDVNGTKVAWNEVTANTTTFGTLKVTAKDASSVTFEQTALNFKAALTEYVVALRNANESLLTSYTASNAVLPNDRVDEETWVHVNAGELTVVYVGTTFGSGTRELKLNINQGAATADKSLIKLYDLAFEIADKTASFKEGNELVSASTVVYSLVNGTNVVAVTVDVTRLGIEADAEYAFELKNGADPTSLLYMVDTERTLTAADADDEAAKVDVYANSCGHYGTKGKALTKDTVVLYYDIEAVNELKTHTWGDSADADGFFTCSVCGAFKKDGDAKNAVVAAEKLANVAKNGLTVTFHGQGDSSQDWHIQSITTNEGNLSIALPNLIGNAKSKLTDKVTSDTTKAYFNKITENAWPDAHSVKHNGATWDVFDKNVSYVTIVISPTAGITLYRNGVIQIEYKAATKLNGNFTTNDFANAMLGLMEVGGFTFGKANLLKAEDLRVLPNALSAEEVADNYDRLQNEHTHVYDPETDRCPTDGALKPGHVHDYTSGTKTDYCKCGEFNPDHQHSFESGVCAACGARQVSVEQGGKTYTGVAEQDKNFENLDTDGGWWNGTTSSVILGADENRIAIIEWENVRDKNYYDFCFEIISAEDVDEPDAWAKAGGCIRLEPTFYGGPYSNGEEAATTGDTPADAGAENCGYGSYKATAIKANGILSLKVEFTANGSESITWTRTVSIDLSNTKLPAGDLAVRLAANPVMLDNIVAYTGTLTEVNA